jgi:acetyl/propionyl-CoA carboxylase alpha subunit
MKDIAPKGDFTSDAFSQKAQALANYQRTDFAKDLPVVQPTVGQADPRLAGLTEQMQPMTQDEAQVELLKGLAALGAAAGALSQAMTEDPQNAAAMKMEQAIAAPRDGVVSKVSAEVGTTVKAGFVLLSLEKDS